MVATRNRVRIVQMKQIMRSIKETIGGVKILCHEVTLFKKQWKNRNNT